MSQIWSVRAAMPRELPEDTLGLCDPRQNTITIQPDLPASVLLQTFAHELVHLIEMTMQLHLTETQVDSLGTGIVHLLAENPDLIELFATELDKLNES